MKRQLKEKKKLYQTQQNEKRFQMDHQMRRSGDSTKPLRFMSPQDPLHTIISMGNEPESNRYSNTGLQVFNRNKSQEQNFSQ